MEEQGGVLGVMPGDMIEWNVEVHSRSRLTRVRAAFVEDSGGPSRQRRLALRGEVDSFEKSGAERVSYGTLLYSRDHSNEIVPGDYRLISVECITTSGRLLSLPPDLLPSLVIRVEREPDDEIPRLGNSRLGVR